MGRNEELEQVYTNASYVWDGKERPVLSNYTAPWSYYASQQPSTVLSRRQIQAIDYAKLKLQEATKQFENDLSYWNEQDERSYTSPISQTQRYDDAGFNMGYLYSQVDSGNSAVGYNQQSTSIDTQTSDAYKQGLDVVARLVGSALDVSKYVPAIAKLPSELDLNEAREQLAYAQANDSSASAMIQDLQGSWFQFLREHDKDGKQVGYREDGGYDWSNSIAFLLEQENYKLKANERQDLDEWLKQAAKVYKNQSSENVNSANRVANEIWNSDLPKGVKIFLGILQTLLPSTSAGVSYGVTSKR